MRSRRPTKTLLIPASLVLLSLTLLQPLPAAEPVSGPGKVRITPENGSVRIPFEMFRNDIRMLGEINGREVRMLIDNGSVWDQLLFFGSPTVDDLNLQPSGEVQVGGAGSGEPVMADIAEGVSISFPGVEFSDQTAIILPYDPEKPNPWWGAEGQVSAAFFNHFVVDINFDTMMVTLIEPESFRPTRDATELPLMPLDDDSWAIPAEITMEDGVKKSINIMLDLGTGEPLWFNIGEEGDVALPEHHTRASLGFGTQGEIMGWFGRVPSISVGGHTLTDVLAGFSRRDEGGFSCGNAIIGMGLFSRFNIVFDYPHRRMFLTPNKSFDQAVERDMTGMTMRPAANGDYRVVRVTPATPADEAGIRAGDIVTHLNGRPIAEYGRTELEALLRKAGAVLEASTLREGEPRIVSLKLRRLI